MRAARTKGIAATFDRWVAAALPRGRGLDAWRSLFTAHATLMRRLDLDLRAQTDLSLSDFDVLFQLALGDGELRITELAARALVSRSAMTRRVDRLVERRLARRGSPDTDARGVIVAITDKGVAALRDALPVHVRGVSELFLSRLSDRELAALELTLRKVIVDCSFG